MLVVVASLLVSALTGWWLAGESDDFCKRVNCFFEGLLLHVMGMIPGLSQLGLRRSMVVLLGSEETPLEPRYGDAVMYSLLRKLTKTRLPTGGKSMGGVRMPTTHASTSKKNSNSSVDSMSVLGASGSNVSDGDSTSDQGLDALLSESVLEKMVQEALRDASAATSSTSSLPPLHSSTLMNSGDEVSKVDKPILVLDLDETLIHSSVEPKSMCNHSFALFDEEQRQYFFVFKRPFVETFLHLLAHHYDIAVFTASYSCYRYVVAIMGMRWCDDAFYLSLLVQSSKISNKNSKTH